MPDGSPRDPHAQASAHSARTRIVTPDRASSAVTHLAAITFFFALALLMTWPLALNLRAAVPGNGYDSWQNIWNLWHFKQALRQGQHPFVTTQLYYPTGISLYLHTLSPLNFLVSLPVQARFGLIAAYNFVVLFSLTASGYAAYLLGRAETGAHRAALVAGTIFATSGYLLAQVVGGHANLFAAELLPLAVLGVRRAVHNPAWRSSGLAAVLIAANALCDWQYFLFSVLFAAWYALYVAVTTRRLRPVLPLVVAVALAGVLVLPLAIPTAALAARTPTAATEGGPAFRIQNALDPVDLLAPSQLHPIWGRLAEQVQRHKAWQEIQNKTGYLGGMTLFLAVVALREPKSRFWWATAAVFALLALGPRLQLAGHLTAVPLPVALLYRLPLINVSRYPLRFVVMTMLALAVLGALGSQRLVAWLAARRKPVQRLRPLAAWALLGAIVLDNLPLPLPLIGVYIPPRYAELAQDRGDYGIFEAPLTYRTSAAYLLYQTVHTKPIVGGYVSRRQPYPLLDELPLLQAFAAAQPRADIITQAPEAIAASVFHYFKIRYLLLHSAGGALRDPWLERVARAAAHGEPEVFGESGLARDARTSSRLRRTFGHVALDPGSDVLLYRVQEPEVPVPFLGLGPGWSAPLERGDQVARRIETAAEVAIYSTQPQRVDLELLLTSTRSGSIAVASDGQAGAQVEVRAGTQRIVVPLTIESGRTSVMLSLAGSGPIDVTAVEIAGAQGKAASAAGSGERRHARRRNAARLPLPPVSSPGSDVPARGR